MVEDAQGDDEVPNIGQEDITICTVPGIGG